jgi:hypothetical protein
MNRAFTKLSSSIITSTIWREDDKTRIVWITLLALADQHGEVAASIPGLAAMANVAVDECERALRKLESSDPYSRTKDYEGRRIESVDGGWRVLNYRKYRSTRDDEARREYQRDWDREHRPSGHQRTKQSDHSPTKSDQIRPKQKQNKKPSVSLSELAFRLAKLLLDLILDRKPDFRRPNLQSWAKEIDRMIRLDRRTPERIEAVIRWAQSDLFWQNNILSASKLRGQFDQLELKMGSQSQRSTAPVESVSPLTRGPDGLTPEEQVRQQELRAKEARAV